MTINTWPKPRPGIRQINNKNYFSPDEERERAIESIVVLQGVCLCGGVISELCLKVYFNSQN